MATSNHTRISTTLTDMTPRQQEEEQGCIACDWYFRPTHIKHLSHGLIVHSLTLTRFLVGARAWARSRPGIAIPKLNISYEMERSPGKVEVLMDGKRASVKVIPDAWNRCPS